jgi:hypothetical protein
MQRTSSSLRYVKCGTVHIQSTYSSAYSDFNIQLIVSALQLEISRQFNARCTAFLVPDTEHIVQFTLCDLWSRLYTKYLQLHLLRLQYSAAGIIAAIVDITSILCALYCNLGANYSAHASFCAIWSVVPAKYKAFTDPHTNLSIFSCRYLRCYCRYQDNWMLVIL